MERPEPLINPLKGDHKAILIALFGPVVNNEVEEAGSGKPLGRERNVQLESNLLCHQRRTPSGLLHLEDVVDKIA